MREAAIIKVVNFLLLVVNNFYCWEDILMFMFPSTPPYFTLVKRMGTHLCMVSKYFYWCIISSGLVFCNKD